MKELWRPVVRYEDYYEVSSLGRVRRLHGGRGAVAGRILRRAERSTSDEYRFVQLCRRDQKRTFGVHVLVAEAFLGRRPRGKLANHRNLDKSDNRVSNLEWVTPKQNAQHALRAGQGGGRPMPGESNGRAKLNVRQVATILRCKGRVGQRTLAVLCGVSKTAIQKIHQGKGWRAADLRVREYPKSN